MVLSQINCKRNKKYIIHSPRCTRMSLSFTETIQRIQIRGTNRSARDELHESEARKASLSCFDDTGPEKSRFIVDLVCSILPCLRDFVFQTRGVSLIWLYKCVRSQRVWFFSRLSRKRVSIFAIIFWSQIGYGFCTLVFYWVCLKKLLFHHYR